METHEEEKKILDLKIELAKDKNQLTIFNEMINEGLIGKSFFENKLLSNLDVHDQYLDYVNNGQFPDSLGHIDKQAIINTDLNYEFMAEKILNVSLKTVLTNRLNWLKKLNFFDDAIYPTFDRNDKRNAQTISLVINDILTNTDYDPESILNVAQIVFNDKHFSGKYYDNALKDKLYLSAFQVFSKIEDPKIKNSYTSLIDDLKTSEKSKHLSKLFLDQDSKKSKILDINKKFDNYQKSLERDGFNFSNFTPFSTRNKQDLGFGGNIFPTKKTNEITVKSEKDVSQVLTLEMEKAKEDLVDLCSQSGITQRNRGLSTIYVRKNEKGVSEQLFKTSKFPRTKINFSNTPKDELEFEISALSVVQSGIKRPLINCFEKDADGRKEFILGHLNALVNVGYDIEDIAVDKDSLSILEEFKTSMRKDVILEQDSVLSDDLKAPELAPKEVLGIGDGDSVEEPEIIAEIVDGDENIQPMIDNSELIEFLKKYDEDKNEESINSVKKPSVSKLKLH